ncbi:hypothetical protein TBCH5v1_2476 [Thermococcus barophilus]|uniref:Uncharacterized protein n=2 Tax=Thermococcus barophilus TaxID=55802 RepID=A0A0S1XEY5_THEBA|nr:hypothetical protein TBCH5v1_2476 [Thermococcus barophilus]
MKWGCGMSGGIFVKVEFPADVVKIIGMKDLDTEVRLLTAIELYREGKVSLGKAAEIAGLSIREFLYELRKRDIPINYDLEELKKDIETIEGL